MSQANGQGQASTKEILHAIPSALVVGLVVMMGFILFAAVYASAASAGGASPFFSSSGDMATFGFFIGFFGRLAPIFEKYI